MESRVGKDESLKGPVKKPTGFMTLSWCLYDELNRQCRPDLEHVHVPLMEGRAAAAQVYPDPLCRAICKGIAKQKSVDQDIGHVTSKLLGLDHLNSINQSGVRAIPC